MWIFLATAIASALLVALVRREALRRRLLDVPNERSSHVVPVPRGGGLAVVAVFLSAITVSYSSQAVSATLFGALAGAVLVAVTGLFDDRMSLPVGLRLALHALAAAAFATFALATIDMPGPRTIWFVWWCFWVVSSVNVVNFIDGIDGLIGLQAVVFGAFMAAAAPTGSTAALWGLVLAGSALGFLLWNWTPAKIFLGDVGSGAIGYFIAMGGLLLMRDAGLPMIIAWLPVYAIFLDAAATLIRRWRRGERLTVAHRSHLYQLLSREWGHARVSLLYGAVAAAGGVIAVTQQPARNALAAAYALIVFAAGAALSRWVAGREAFPARRTDL